MNALKVLTLAACMGTAGPACISEPQQAAAVSGYNSEMKLTEMY